MVVKTNKKSVIKDLFTSISLHATLMEMNPVNPEKSEQHYLEH